MALASGTRLGPYEVLTLLGAGGMGEVYRARDTKLNRDVALKILPDAFALDGDRIARFRREAQVLASLNHPNIAAIYGFEDRGSTHALVLELVEGATLADRIAKGPISLDEALPIAQQIAGALEAAHEQGIIHRDLKPANIKLRDDGTVKVLDFGLAKAMEPASAISPVLTASPTITTPAQMTGVGMILGTAAYMSPEQAKGRPADKRSDLWSFGCVLYEMLTGRRAFPGDRLDQTIASVLTNAPEWSNLPPEVPPAIRTLLKRCLERESRKRIGDVAAVQFVLEEAATLSTASSAGEANAAGHGRALQRTTWTLVALAAMVVIALVASRLRPTPQKPFTFSILPPERTTFAGITSGGPPALSPDGRHISYAANGPAGRQLWVQSIDAFDARPLTGTEGAAAPFWSPDGSWLGFVADQTLKKVSTAGGQPQQLARAFTLNQSGTWSHDGTIVFYGGRNNTLAWVSASGGESAQATERNISLFDENHMAPSFLPDGRHYLLSVRGGPDLQSQVWVGELGSNNRTFLLRDVTNAHFASPRSRGPGHLVYVRDRVLMAQSFDPGKLTLLGTAVAVADGVAVSPTGWYGDFTISANGVLAYRRAVPGKDELASYDREGKPIGTVGDRAGNPRNNVRMSPDGKWAAFTRMGETSQDVWIAALATGDVSRFTFQGGRSPVWSPDGTQLAFLREDTIYRKPFMKGGAEVAVWSGPGTLAINDWSGDGKFLLLTRWDTSKPALTGRDLWLLPDPLADGVSHAPILFESDALHGQFGPKIGPPRWVSFDAFDGSMRQVFVRTMPGARPGKWQISTTMGNTSRWRADGRELFFLSGSSIVAADIESSVSFRAGALHTLFEGPPAFTTAASQYAPGWDASPDGRRFLTTFPAPDVPARAITVVMNWDAMLEK